VALLLNVLWQWGPDSPHAGARFWASHATDGKDGRLRDWPKMALIPLGAALVEVIEGDGLELVEQYRPVA